MFDPDPNKKPKRPPPLPSFGNSKVEPVKKDSEMDKKLDSFFAEINKEILFSKNTEASVQKSAKIQLQKIEPSSANIQQPVTQQSQIPQTSQKKLSLASINSKLNSMLSTKKINLNATVTKPSEPLKTINLPNPQRVQKKRNQLPGQYDPNTPNNFDLSKHFYAEKLAQLQQESDEEDQNISKAIVNKNGLGLQKLTEEMKSEQQVPEPVQEEEVLEEKEQVALRMMQKFGYKVGTGLGKQSQGITTPLTIKKTTDTSCVIEQSSINLNQIIRPQISAKNALLAHNIVPTQVIVFINLIKMQNFTEVVEKQLKQECSTFGQIKNWLVFLLKNNEGKQEVRIFVEYEKKEDAFLAFCKLNNRYYGESLASIRFYPKDLFEKFNLSDPVHTHIET